MWPDQVSNPGPLALESDALPTALHGLASFMNYETIVIICYKRQRCENCS